MARGEVLLVEGDEEFFDPGDDGVSLYESCPESPDSCASSAMTGLVDYSVWMLAPGSIEDRRSKFHRLMRLASPRKDSIGTDDVGGGLVATAPGGEASATSENGLPCSCSPSSCLLGGEVPDLNCPCMIKNLDDGSVFVAAEVSQDGALKRLRKLGSDQIITIDELHRSLESSFVQRMMRRESSTSASSTSSEASSEVGWEGTDERGSRGRRVGWLKKLGVAACIIDREGPDNNIVSSEYQPTGTMYRRVGVHSHKKQVKEFSALYSAQDIGAHSGAIWAMKFSHDGQYLASGGEDGVVRVWKVVERSWSNEEHIIEKDPSCIYLKANSKHELSPVTTNKEKRHGLGAMRISTDSTFVVLPPKVFSISEKPLHEFHGHAGDILSLSWAKNQYLISSSTDKTVRLWRVGCETCIQVFPHNDYVTCVQFHPTSDNYFISGSIDGKVRIWDASTCSVVNWTGIKDMITAVCYKPDGQGVIVGTMAGNCRFYSILDDCMQLDKEVSFHIKKKSSSKRITGFQFSPIDPQKLMVSSADSRIRILRGHDIVSKYKGYKNAGSQISASFSSDGRHIVSASEDANVYIWNQSSSSSSAKHVKSSATYEHFLSDNVSVAMAWDKIDHGSHVSPLQVTSSEPEVSQDTDGDREGHHPRHSDLHASSNTDSSSGVCFSLGQQVFVDVVRRGSATWPEEKLPSGSVRAPPTICKSHYKSLKPYFENKIASHAWGQVIVTAGWDGRIKVFHNYGLPVHP